MIALGWITADYPHRPSPRTVWLKSGAMVTMRYRNIALALKAYGFRSSFYRPDRRYDAVVIIKTFTDPVLEEVERLKATGTRIIFDANVNYYYIWGDYADPKTQPRADEQRSAMQITQQADHVIADSEYLREVVRDFNPQVTWIPDNVLPLLFRPVAHRAGAGNLRLIWSGISFKSNELLLIKEALGAVKGLELWLVSEKRPTVLEALENVLPTRWFRYSDLYYAYLLGKADAVISPRFLNNGYNLGHTEYKITLGMGRSLPALASPQPAYITALQRGGGMICYDQTEWIEVFKRLRDEPEFRLKLGQQARQTVEKYYLTPVVAAQYADMLHRLLRK